MAKIVRSDANIPRNRNLDWMPRVLLSYRHAMPMTWSIWRPTVLLPGEARKWAARRPRI